MINIVYLAWNRREFTKISLASIEKHTHWDAVNKFLLLDDFSEDGTWKLCQEWARGKAKVEVMRRHNTTMGTGEPFAWAGERMGGDCWTLLLPNDCAFCEDVIGVFDGLAKEDADALNSLPVHLLPDDPEYWNLERRTIHVGNLTGGLVAIAPGLIHAIHEQLVITKEPCSTHGIFHVVLPRAGIPFRTRRVVPSVRCVFLDRDLCKPNAVVMAMLHAAKLHPSRALALTAKYAAAGWSRSCVRDDGKTTDLADVELDRKLHQWVPSKE